MPTVQSPAATSPKFSVSLGNSLVSSNVAMVLENLTERIIGFAKSGGEVVDIDLSHLVEIDLRGAEAFRSIVRWARKQKMQILFSGASESTRMVLRIQGVDLLLLEGGQ